MGGRETSFYCSPFLPSKILQGFRECLLPKENLFWLPDHQAEAVLVQDKPKLELELELAGLSGSGSGPENIVLDPDCSLAEKRQERKESSASSLAIQAPYLGPS